MSLRCCLQQSTRIGRWAGGNVLDTLVLGVFEGKVLFGMISALMVNGDALCCVFMIDVYNLGRRPEVEGGEDGADDSIDSCKAGSGLGDGAASIAWAGRQ